MSDYKSSIGISIKLDPKNQVENDLNQILTKLNSSQLNISINPQVSQQLKEVANNLSNIYNKSSKSISLDSLTTSAKESAKVFQSIGEEIGKIHEKSGLKINTNNGLQEAKEINRILKDNYQATIKEAEAQKQVQQEIEKQTKLLEIQKQTLNRQYGNKIDTSYIDESISKLKSMDNISMKGLKSEIANIKIGIKDITEQAKSTEGMFSKLGNSLRNVGIYIDIGDVIRGISNSIKDATEYVIKLDSAMVNLKKVTQETNATYSTFLSQAHNIAMDYGSQADKVVDATTSWAKTGESLKNATELAKSTMLLTKVGDVENVSTAQQYMIAPLKAFQIEADKSITLIDKYNNISNNMATDTMDLGEALSKSASSMATAGNTLEQTLALIATAESQTKLGGDVVGQAMKTTSLRIATFKDENGELIPKFEEQLKSLGVTMRDTTTGQILPTFEILKSVGEKFKTMDTNSKLNVSQLLGGKLQANVVSSILNNVDELNRAYNLAENSANSAINEFGTYQQGVQYSIDQLKESINNLYTKLVSSSGLKVFVEGLTDVVDVFGNMPAIIGLATTALLIFKGQAIMGAIQGLGALVAGETAMTIATTGASLAWEKLSLAMSANPLGVIAIAITGAILLIQKLQNAQENLKKSNDEVIRSYKSEKEAMTSSTQLLKQKQKVEEQLANTNDGTEKNKNLKTQLLDIERQLAQALPNSATQYDEQGKAIATNNDLIKKQIDLKKQAMLDETLNQLDKNNSGFSSLSWSPKDIIGEGTNMGYGATTLENIDKTIEKYKQLKLEAEKTLNEATTSFGKSSASEDLQRYSKMLDEATSKSSQYKLLIMNALDAGKSTSDLAERFGISEDVIKSYGLTVENTTQKQKENSNQTDDNANKTKVLVEANKELQSSNGQLSADTIKQIAETYPDVGDSADKAKEKVDEFNNTLKDAKTKEIEEASNSYEKSAEAIAKAQGFLDKLNKTGEVTPTIASQILKVYPELATQLGSISSLQEGLNNKIKEQQISQSEAYLIMMQDDETFYQNKIANNNEFKSAYNNFLKGFVADGKEADDIDFKNYTTYANFKEDAQSKLGQAIETWLTQFVGESAKGYATDFENFRSTAEQKASVLDKLNQEIKKINSNLAGAEALKETIADKENYNKIVGIDSQYDPLSRVYQDVGSRIDGNVEKWKAKANELNGAIQEVDTKFNEFGASMKGFSGGGLGGTSDFSGTGGGSGKADKSAEESEKWKDKINDLNSSIETDRYYDANNALSVLENTMQSLKTSEEGLTGAELTKVKTQENEVIGKQIEAYKNLQKVQEGERDELKQKLAQYGILTDSTGQLVNAQGKLAEQQAKVNSMSGNTENEYNAKKDAIEQTKILSEEVKRYGEIVNSTIPDTIDKYEALANSIKKAKIEEIENLKDELVKGLQKKYEDEKETKLDSVEAWYKTKKEALQSEYESDKKNLQNEMQDEVDHYQGLIDDLQKRLDILNDDGSQRQAKLSKLKAELSLWTADTSVFSKAKQESLKNSISDLEKEIEKDTIQKQIDGLKEKQDAEKTYNEDKLTDLEDSNKEQEKELEDSYNKQKKEAEDMYEKLLDEHSLYAEADKLILSNQMDSMLTLLESTSEDFKTVGTLLGTNFKEGLITEIQSALQSASYLTGKNIGGNSSDNNTNSSSSSFVAKNGHHVWIENASSDEIYSDASHNKSKGTGWSNGVASADELIATGYENGFMRVSDANGNDLGWVENSKLKKFATGGRIGNVGSQGALVIADDNEMIANAGDTKKFDEMYNYIANSGGLISQLSNQYSNLGNYTMPSVSTDLNSLTNGVTNNNNNNTSSSQSISMPVTIINQKGAEAVTEQQIEKIMTKVTKKQATRYGGRS